MQSIKDNEQNLTYLIKRNFTLGSQKVNENQNKKALEDLLEELETEVSVQEQKNAKVNDGFDTDEEEVDHLKWLDSEDDESIFG